MAQQKSSTGVEEVINRVVTMTIESMSASSVRLHKIIMDDEDRHIV